MCQASESSSPNGNPFREVLRRALRDELSQREVTVLLLIYVEELTLTETAMVLQENEAATQALFEQAREKMREAVMAGRLPLPGEPTLAETGAADAPDTGPDRSPSDEPPLAATA